MFAGNYLFISPESLIEDGLLKQEDFNNIPNFNSAKVEFGKVKNYKSRLLKKAFNNFIKDNKGFKNQFEQFCEENNFWLNNYALFMAVKNAHEENEWTKWEKGVAQRNEKSIIEWSDKLKDEIKYNKFVQFIFFHQWKKLKKYANEKGIKIIGDIPFFIANDSADLWENRKHFTVDEKGKTIFVAGVPPDYFSPKGQLWGNPLYNWDTLEKDNFNWWVERIKHHLKYFDVLRMDHFRGFDACWSVSGNLKTAKEGKWIKVPGEKLFLELKKHIGGLPIIAEDLGAITKSVIELRDKFNFYGMKILQFAFDGDFKNDYLPHNYESNTVVYTGTHDNDTTKGFFEEAKKQNNKAFIFAQKYLNYYGNNLTDELIKTAYKSLANTVIIPMQDILNLGSKARMNLPGKFGGNWSWRFNWEQVSNNLHSKYKRLTEITNRY